MSFWSSLRTGIHCYPKSSQQYSYLVFVKNRQTLLPNKLSATFLLGLRSERPENCLADLVIKVSAIRAGSIPLAPWGFVRVESVETF